MRGPVAARPGRREEAVRERETHDEQQTGKRDTWQPEITRGAVPWWAYDQEDPERMARMAIASVVAQKALTAEARAQCLLAVDELADDIAHTLPTAER